MEIKKLFEVRTKPSEMEAFFHNFIDEFEKMPLKIPFLFLDGSSAASTNGNLDKPSQVIRHALEVENT